MKFCNISWLCSFFLIIFLNVVVVDDLDIFIGMLNSV